MQLSVVVNEVLSQNDHLNPNESSIRGMYYLLRTYQKELILFNHLHHLHHKNIRNRSSKSYLIRQKISLEKRRVETEEKKEDEQDEIIPEYKENDSNWSKIKKGTKKFLRWRHKKFRRKPGRIFFLLFIFLVLIIFQSTTKESEIVEIVLETMGIFFGILGH